MTNTKTHIPLILDTKRLIDLLRVAWPVSRVTWLRVGEYDAPGITNAFRALEEGYTITVKPPKSGDYTVCPVYPISTVRLAMAVAELLAAGSPAACAFLQGKEDAATADVILQQAVFGEVVYG